ncbi:tRNA-binding protein [bacterium]|jgi:tRNA-binding protein|nr:tRNA-binding protein [bacterium]MBT4577817.1 tRNA-binding protein [bacterium]MBT5345451.1 tRNA-binding protein [bacterium]MBT6131145.1 tRNA-binding protein [bacterium]MBT6528505.1 tRNA-binding protein [bacterium]
MKMITYDDFEQVELRSGTVVRAKTFDKARKPSYKIWVDFGSKIGVKQTAAQVTNHYTLETIVGRQVVGCVNLAVRKVAGFESEFLLVGFSDKDNNVCLVTVDPVVQDGAKLF